MSANSISRKMRRPPKTILTIGGNAETFFQLNRWLPRYRLVPLLDPPSGKKLPFNPGLILLFQLEEAPALGARLATLQKCYPSIPILVLQGQKAPALTEVIATFHHGVQAYLEWPCAATLLQQKIALHFKKSFDWKWLFSFWKQPPALPTSYERTQEASNGAPGLSFFFNHVPHLKDPDLRVNFFGNFSMKAQETPLPPIRSRLKNALLSYMLYHRNQHLHREKLMDLFWPDVPCDASRNSLNVAISQLRHYLRPHLPVDEVLLFRNEGYIFQPELEILTDVEQFVTLCQQGGTALKAGHPEEVRRLLDQAKGLYHQDFMANLPYEDWCTNERDALKEKYLSILHGLAQHYYHKKDYLNAIPVAEQILEKDPFLEDIHRLLMDCYARLDQRGRALQQYGKCQHLLKEYFQVEPSQATKVLLEEIRG